MKRENILTIISLLCVMLTGSVDNISASDNSRYTYGFEEVIKDECDLIEVNYIYKADPNTGELLLTGAKVIFWKNYENNKFDYKLGKFVDEWMVLDYRAMVEETWGNGLTKESSLMPQHKIVDGKSVWYCEFVDPRPYYYQKYCQRLVSAPKIKVSHTDYDKENAEWSDFRFQDTRIYEGRQGLTRPLR